MRGKADEKGVGSGSELTSSMSRSRPPVPLRDRLEPFSSVVLAAPVDMLKSAVPGARADVKPMGTSRSPT
jgi:hypothetical protein